MATRQDMPSPDLSPADQSPSLLLVPCVVHSARAKLRAAATFAALLLVAPSLMANAATDESLPCGVDIAARFTESAPRDRFEIVNQSQASATISSATINLAGSSGKLIFDTADGGIGVEVFQPFQVADGEDLLTKASIPEDGAETVELAFSGFESEKRFAFTIDVDDRLTRSDLGQIRVSGSEIRGASVMLSLAEEDGSTTMFTASFDEMARASFVGEECSA